MNNKLNHIANKLLIGNRNECIKKREAFISFKDHKENFENNPKCRLINPAKSDSGKINKSILDKINTKLRSILNVEEHAKRHRRTALMKKLGILFLSFDIADLPANF